MADTFSMTAINNTAHSPGHAANVAEDRKIAHYTNLQRDYIFTPVSFETTGVYGKITEKFISELGRKMRGNSGEIREAQWLRRRISIAIVRGNAASVMGTGQFASFYPGP